MEISLVTERLLIRRFRMEDWRRLQEYVSKPEVTRLDAAYPVDDAEIQQVVSFFASTPDFLAVCLRGNEQLIGHLHIGVRDEEPSGWRNLGFAFDSAVWSRGYASESCRAILDFAFSELDTPGFRTGTQSENFPAIKLLTKLGFERSRTADADEFVFELGRPIQ